MDFSVFAMISVVVILLSLAIWRLRKAPPAPPRELALMSDQGPVLQLSLCDDKEARTEPVALTSDLKIQLAMMVAPGTAVLTNLHRAGTAMKVVFKSEVAEGLANGTLTLMEGDKGNYLTAIQAQRGGLRPKGQIAGNGQVVANNAARAAALAAAAYQVAAIITAQQFLADIDQKLGEIGKNVDAIQRWQESELLTELSASFAYLREIAISIQAGRLTELERTAYLNQIEIIDRNTAKLSGMCNDKLSQINVHVPSTSWTASGIDDDLTQLKKEDKTRERFVRAGLAAQQIRLLAAQIRSALPTDRQVAVQRLQAAACDITELMAKSDDITTRLKAASDLMKYSTMAGLFRDQGDQQLRKTLRDEVEKTSGALRYESATVAAAGNQLLSLIAGADASNATNLALRVTVDPNGTVIAAERYL